LAIKPSAYFQLASSVVCKDAPFSISDKSVFNATSWKWVVTPSTAIFVDGTSATSQNPVLTFSDIDIPYTIKLIVTNANGADSLTLNNALSASNTLALSATTTPNNEICFCKFDSIQLKGHGADEYSWSISKPENRIYFPTATGQNVAAKLVNNAATESSFTFDIQLIGKQATCIDTVTIPYTVVKPSNDDIQNAITLQTGVSQTYSNKCASIQTNEPHPAITSCTSQTSWCDEYGDGTNIIENTLWFKVIGPDSGILGIKSTGMDDELALYKAATSSDILSGKGVLLAANDDATDIDSNPTLKSVSVTPGQIYWLQVDGSGGGSIGEFTLTVSDTALSTALVTTENKDQLAAYPQPVSDILTLTGLSALKGDAIFTIYSMTGRTVFTHQSSLYNNATQQINVANFAPGMYLLRITINKQVYSLRFIKK